MLNFAEDLGFFLFERLSHYRFLYALLSFFPTFLKMSSLNACFVHGVLSILRENYISVSSSVHFLCEKIVQHSPSYMNIDITQRFGPFSLFLMKCFGFIILWLAFRSYLSLSQCVFWFLSHFPRCLILTSPYRSSRLELLLWLAPIFSDAGKK